MRESVLGEGMVEGQCVHYIRAVCKSTEGSKGALRRECRKGMCEGRGMMWLDVEEQGCNARTARVGRDSNGGRHLSDQ